MFPGPSPVLALAAHLSPNAISPLSMVTIWKPGWNRSGSVHTRLSSPCPNISTSTSGMLSRLLMRHYSGAGEQGGRVRLSECMCAGAAQQARDEMLTSAISRRGAAIGRAAAQHFKAAHQGVDT